MNKIIIVILLFFGFPNMMITCIPRESEECHTSIRVSNNSDKRIRVVTMNSAHMTNPFDITRLSFVMNPAHVVNIGEQNNRAATSVRFCIESDFRNDRSTLFLFVFDANVIENTSWDIVARDYLVLRRYDLTLEDLRRLNWQVTYPPDARMRNVRMWPLSGE